ncbi:PREDICTED: pleckstrin homology-like domain family A member 1 [Tarenaya hassleriana]|uniref:pleckstrin homology-like domain family A member 1 n=1 Tax=Tarenaya hassleriana TaxID=28532 RepID=UPI00053C3628|nr:PREDICTED: pleckstrin homology-like domain family A member 1 [Tarenaya hassleriana]XP_010524013.1 PREDICTED: pleckstrin homology-like domain family A member 1 [Tarenaya hassleriana]
MISGEAKGMRLQWQAAPLLLLLLMLSAVRSQRMPIPAQRPLCTSQYALANYACSHLPLIPNPPLPSASQLPPPPAPEANPPPSPPAHPTPDNDHDDDHDHDHDHEHEDHHRHHHSSHKHHHHGHHRHKARKVEYKESFAEAECCKWLKQMDNECVCDLLLHLPPLLARPVHDYTVFVDESCIVTFSCGGRFIR